MLTTTAKLFKIGDVVSQGGIYVCAPCGYMRRFETGGIFTTCDVCLAGTENGPEEYRNAESEFWQFLG